MPRCVAHQSWLFSIHLHLNIALLRIPCVRVAKGHTQYDDSVRPASYISYTTGDKGGDAKITLEDFEQKHCDFK
jgi:hypothetical protein